MPDLSLRSSMLVRRLSRVVAKAHQEGGVATLTIIGPLSRCSTAAIQVPSVVATTATLTAIYTIPSRFVARRFASPPE